MSEDGLNLRVRNTLGRNQIGHGEAALLLVESLIHQLVSFKVISLRDAVEVVDIAIDAHVESSLPPADGKPDGTGPTALLQAISASLQHDLSDDD